MCVSTPNKVRTKGLNTYPRITGRQSQTKGYSLRNFDYKLYGPPIFAIRVDVNSKLIFAVLHACLYRWIQRIKRTWPVEAVIRSFSGSQRMLTAVCLLSVDQISNHLPEWGFTRTFLLVIINLCYVYCFYILLLCLFCCWSLSCQS